MPVLIILGILSIYGVSGIVNACEKKVPPKSSSQIEQITNEMIGTSKAEARKILREYR